MKRTAAWIFYAAALLLCGALISGAETFSGNLVVRPTWTHEKTGATTASEAFDTLFNWDFTSGTNANQMNQLWVSQRSLTNSATETVDIAGGITNTFGTALTIAEVRMMIVSLSSTNLNTITVGGAAANTFDSWLGDSTDKVSVRPGGFFLLAGPDATGYAVSTNGNLLVTNGGTNAITYDIYIGGSSE